MNVDVRFMQMFDGNRMAIGTEQGGCKHSDMSGWYVAMSEHLDGGPPVGVYPITKDGVCFWGCIDLDEGDQESWIHASNIRNLLNKFDITCWVERSRSKGYHVWVFVDEPTEPVLMREALLAACQMVKAPTREINPKQTELARGEIGNYVRLPYPGRATEGRRCFVDLLGDVLSYGNVIPVAHMTRNKPEALIPLRLKFKPAPKPKRYEPENLEGDSYSRLNAISRKILVEGPLEGMDRSSTLYKLSMHIAEHGQHTHDEAVRIMRIADGRWGKFSERKDCEERIQEVVDKAWAQVFRTKEK